MTIGIMASGVGAGPAIGAPVRMSKRLPWHGQAIAPFWTPITVHPWWVQTAEKARVVPSGARVSTIPALVTTRPVAGETWSTRASGRPLLGGTMPSCPSSGQREPGSGEEPQRSGEPEADQRRQHRTAGHREEPPGQVAGAQADHLGRIRTVEGAPGDAVHDHPRVAGDEAERPEAVHSDREREHE